MMKKLVVILGVVILILLGIFFFYNPAQGPTVPTAPQSIVSTDGHLAISSLQDGDLISSPLTVTGTVTGGGWFNEATFPVKVADGDGRIIGTGVAQAQSEWTSTGTVPFTAIINFTTPRFTSGTVVFFKDNPSGQPANDATLSIPVMFQ